MKSSPGATTTGANRPLNNSQEFQIAVLLNNLALAYEGVMQDDKSLSLQLESLQLK